MRSKEFITEAENPKIQSILQEIANVYNIDTDIINQMAKIARADKMKLHVLEELIQIGQQCKPYIREVGGWDKCFNLHRGISNATASDFIYKRVRTTRSPKAMSEYLFDEINRFFEHVYGYKFRHSMLTTGSKGHALRFGNVYTVFPVGEFKFLWNEKVQDLNFALADFRDSPAIKKRIKPGTSVFNAENTEMIEDHFLDEVKELDWHTIDLKSAIEYEAEIMIRCDAYRGIFTKDVDQHGDAMKKIIGLVK